MHIGIFLGYGPFVSLKAEGLGRYLGNLLKGFVESDNKITIGCAKWLLPAFAELLEEFEIDDSNFQYVVEYKTPAVLTIYKFLKRTKRPRVSKRFKIYRSLVEIAEMLFSLAATFTNLVLLTLLALLMGLFLVALSPILLLVLLLYSVYKLLRMGKDKTENKIKKLIVSFFSAFKQFSKERSSLDTYIFGKMNTDILGRLIKKINRGSTRDIWFVPGLFWPQVKEIKETKAIVSPDLVTIAYPQLFTDFDFVATTDNCKILIENECNFITYCDYIKRELLVRRFQKKPSQVVAISHAINAMDSLIALDHSLNVRLHTDKDLTYTFARTLWKDIKGKALLSERYLSSFDFEHMQYVFYASQLRPHKNILNLIKAYEYLLRKKYIKQKLIFTCRVGIIPTIYQYIIENKLEKDVLFFPDVAAQELAAMYKCADLVVNPTLFEGGFPFTFGEGMSVGTPSIMSNIPVVVEIMAEYELCDLLFEPLDIMDMAEKIEYGLTHRQEVYERELPLYRDLSKRTAALVSREYVDAFRYFINGKAKTEDITVWEKRTHK